MSNNIPLKSKEIKKLRDKEIRALHRIGYTMDQICQKVNASKTTVFFAVNRPKNKNKKVKI